MLQALMYVQCGVLVGMGIKLPHAAAGVRVVVTVAGVVIFAALFFAERSEP